jgi:hypothetical protein
MLRGSCCYTVEVLVAAASVADWVSAGSDVLAAVGTIGAFATGFYLIRRDRDLARSAQVNTPSSLKRPRVWWRF